MKENFSLKKKILIINFIGTIPVQTDSFINRTEIKVGDVNKRLISIY